MPTSSAAVSGLYIPKRTPRRKLPDRSPKSSQQSATEPQQVNADVTKIEEIPSKTKLVRGGFLKSKACKIIAAVIAACLVATAIAVSVALVLTSSTTTTATITTTATTTSATTVTTTTSTSTTTTNIVCGSTCVNSTTSISSRVAFYSFDSTTADATGNYPASGISSPTYVTGWVGSAISFTASNAQRLSTSYIPLNSRSFTIEFWFYTMDVSSNWDFSFMGQFVAQSLHQCLFINIRNQALFIGFYADDTPSNTTLSINRWYHAAFVFDYSALKRIIYLNGLCVGVSSATNGLQTTSGAFTIGGAMIGGNTALNVYYTGYIDHLTISYRVKSDCEIYLDATLACYFPFDSTAPLADSGPNFLTATNTGASSTTGRVNQAWRFSSSLSYITVSGISALLTQYNTFSISMWVNPTSVVGGGTLIHTASLSSGTGTCLTMWGLTSSGFVTVNVINGSNIAVSAAATSALSVGAWTHITQTFSATNGNRLYINGTLVTTVNSPSGTAVGPFVFIGASPAGTSSCSAGTIATGQFYGSVDEFRVFGRELTTFDICRLANP